jgi:hypothetical protein
VKTLTAALLSLIVSATAYGVILDDFEWPDAWSAHPSDGVELRISQDQGLHGKAMRLDFDFHGGAGYAIARRTVDLDLPANWELAFWMRAAAPPNNLEFKLVDPTGDNVWWVNRRMFEFPREWTQIRIRQRQVEFAWGPLGGGEPHKIAALEIVITAGTGGKGTVWIDDLTCTERPPVPANPPAPRVWGSKPGAERVLDAKRDTLWRAPAGEQALTFDFTAPRELGGLLVDWGTNAARDYDVEISDDASSWTIAHKVRDGNGGRDFIPLPDTETRYLRLHLLRSIGSTGYALREVTIEPPSWSATATEFFSAVARAQRRGLYPRYLYGEQSYWTVVGVDADDAEALINEDGAIEPFAGGFSIEPFLIARGDLVTWNDVKREQTLADGYLPIPTVQWRAPSGVTLTTTAIAIGDPGQSTLLVRYRLTNRSKQPVKIGLAIRPFQVNPPWQFLGTPGGASRIRNIQYDGAAVHVDDHRIVPVTKPGRFRAATFDQAETADLALGGGGNAQGVTDDRGSASAVMMFDAPEVVIAVPFHKESPQWRSFDDELRTTADDWRGKLDQVQISIPGAPEITDTLRATVAYMLINRDGPAIQPGSRAYARSWIRDGSLTSAALLRLGHADAARDFLKWYAPFDFPSGKVPCCVDHRGADPVPENDSNGELLFLAAEYYRFTHDRALIESLWPLLDNAAAYIDTLRKQRMTPEFASGPKRMFYGLLPESISHEGYSAKAMHSYWDDFFALKGLKDAAFLAAELGRDDDRRRFAEMAGHLRKSILDSLQLTIAEHHIDFIPGSAELGDFDATSTSIALEPAGERASLPQGPLLRAFDKYYLQTFVPRRDGKLAWDAYTPYELRNVATFIRLGQKDRAHEALQYFMHDRRPIGWRHWAEVVWRDPRAPKFIGDMPHTWVGSDFIRSVTDFFAYDEGDALVVGAGIPREWLRSGPVRIRHLHTQFGELDLEIQADRMSLTGTAAPPGGFVVKSPIDGAETKVQTLPATLVFK